MADDQRILITCPQMQLGLQQYESALRNMGLTPVAPELQQQLSEQELIEIIPSFVGVIAGDDPFTRRVLEKAQRLKIISKWGTGIDNIDIGAAAEFGIRVTNTPGLFGDDVADLIVGYMVMLARGLHLIDREVRRGHWFKPQGAALGGKTLGIVGLGTIGRALATRAMAMRMRVQGIDPSSESRSKAVELGVEIAELDQLLASSHFVSLNCPLTPKTEGLLDGRRLKLMRSDAFLINAGRGRLIEEKTLIAALESGAIRGAALDVFETEPLPSSSPLISMDNCLLGSHNASNTLEASHRVNELAVANLLEALGHG